MIIMNPKYNSLPGQVEKNKDDIQKIDETHLIDVDDELSTQSTNPVQNKIITGALDTEEFERKQADEDLTNGKLSKVTNQNVVYATNVSGEQTTVPYTPSKDVQGTIVQRDENRDVLVPSSPTGNNSATSKSYVDSLTKPTTWQSLTRNDTNTASGSVGRYFQIGKLVVVYLRVNTTADCPDNAGTLFTGLPAPQLTSLQWNEFVLALSGSNLAKTNGLRVKITNTGEIQTCYTDAANYTSDGIDETFCYLAQ